MKPCALLAIDEKCWRLVHLKGQECLTRELPCDGNEVSALKAALSEHRLERAAVCLGLPSAKTLLAGIECGNLPRKDRRTAMLYRLEEQLPLDVESLTVDFLPQAGGRALGIAVETSYVQGILRRLAEAGIEPHSACWRASRQDG